MGKTKRSFEIESRRKLRVKKGSHRTADSLGKEEGKKGGKVTSRNVERFAGKKKKIGPFEKQ